MQEVALANDDCGGLTRPMACLGVQIAPFNASTMTVCACNRSNACVSLKRKEKASKLMPAMDREYLRNSGSSDNVTFLKCKENVLLRSYPKEQEINTRIRQMGIIGPD